MRVVLGVPRVVETVKLKEVASVKIWHMTAVKKYCSIYPDIKKVFCLYLIKIKNYVAANKVWNTTYLFELI